MPRLILIYIALFSAIYLITYFWSRRGKTATSKEGSSRERFRSKATKGTWVQVYDTDSVDDAKRILARLEEEELECILYEQGRKDVHGNALKGFGIAVPRSLVSRAQNLLSRMPV